MIYAMIIVFMVLSIAALTALVGLGLFALVSFARTLVSKRKEK